MICESPRPSNPPRPSHWLPHHHDSTRPFPPFVPENLRRPRRGRRRSLTAVLPARAAKATGPLLAYVGTFSSPLKDMLPTQVDLPPGNGRGIHLFQVDRATGRDDAGRRPRDWAPARAAWR